MLDPADRSDEGLVRAIGVPALAANAVNLTIGAGIFVLPSVLAAELGASAVVAYVVCAAAIALVMLCFAEAGSRIARSGGVYAYVDEAFGPYPAFLVGTLFWFGFAVMSDAAIAAALMSTLASVVPALGNPITRAVVLALLFAGLAAVNVRGVRQGASMAVASTIAKLVPLVLLVAIGMPHVSSTSFAGVAVPPLERLGAASLVLFYAFGGAESALVPGGEIRDPARTVPRALLIGVCGVFLLYAGLHLVAQGVLGDALAVERTAPLASAAAALWGEPGRLLLVAGATIAAFGAICGDMVGTPRTLFGQARHGLLPAALAAVHPRFRTPHVAIVAFSIVAFVSAATGAFERLAILSSVALLLVYLATCLAVLRLRVRSGVPTGFRVPGGPLVPLLAIGVVLWLLSNASRAEAVAVVVFFAAATVAYLSRPARRLAPQEPVSGEPARAADYPG
jgi:amino acid transporter